MRRELLALMLASLACVVVLTVSIVERPTLAIGGIEVQHILLFGSRQGFEGRELFHESFEIGCRLIHTGLLQHKLGNPHPVRRAVGSPGHFALIGAKPGQ